MSPIESSGTHNTKREVTIAIRERTSKQNGQSIVVDTRAGSIITILNDRWMDGVQGSHLILFGAFSGANTSKTFRF